jgi:K+-transporting ATPase ATPase A chain
MLDWTQLFFFIGILAFLAPFLGSYIYRVFSAEGTFAFEGVIYRAAGIDPHEEMTWKDYAKNMLLFNLFGFLALFFLQLLQGFLPLNPQHFAGVPWALAFNTAISFVTNTNWQAYAGETTLSYLTQMAGLTVQNFLSAATGFAVLVALIRGLRAASKETIGNFWVDLVRGLVYILLPLALLWAVLLVSEGVIQTFSPYAEVTTLEKGHQSIPLGPVASQEAIKQLGTNGGGFFNTNSAHPFENPTPVSNFLEQLALLIIPAATVYAYGLFVGSRKQAFLLFFVMGLMWLWEFFVMVLSEGVHNPSLGVFPVLEGQETRLGGINSLLWINSTTVTSNGSVNAMISSLTPLTGGVALFNMMLGELIFGGVGVGLCSMLMFVLLTVFLSGLMVGRTPEYLGKKIEKREIQWVTVALLTPGALILIGAGISSILPVALGGLGNAGPHGLTEILYAFTSAAANNGSAFAGLNANTDYYNLSLGIIMFLARLAILVPSVALAGYLARKKMTPPSIGTFSTDTFLFAFMLLGVILIVGGLTFFPALSLGPIVEQLLMLDGQTF